PDASEGSGAPAAGEDAIASALSPLACGAVLFASGFATLAYEIVWFRVFRSIGGNSTYAFTIVLVTFLLGLGTGALGLRPALRRAAPEQVLALVQLLVATTASLAMLGAALVIDDGVGLAITFEQRWVRELAWPARLALHGGAALALMLPATLLMGLSFPLASRMFVGSGGLARVDERVGLAVLLANAGSIAGSIVAATVLLPTLGSMASSRAIACVNLAIGLVVAHAAPGSRGERLRWVAPLAIAGVCFAALVPSALPYRQSALGGLPTRVLFTEEGDLATVRVSESVENPRLRGMSIDGVTIGASAGWSYPIYSKQVLIAHLPMWLEPRIRTALQIGLGSASTLDALSRHPDLERIECVEISAAVVRGSAFFEESRVLADPRVHVAVEDAIHWLLRTPARYDLIVADGKQNDDFSGTAKMMSRELYALALDRLTDDGLFVQWVPIGNGVDELRAIVRTQATVFPHLDVFYDPPTSAIFVGSRRPLAGRERMPAAQARARMGRDLAALGLADPTDVRLEWLADREALVRAVGDGPLNTWDHAIVEFASYRADRRQQGALGYAAASNLAWLLDASADARARAPRDLVPATAEG
ncbi:MAG: fused MFS/spermidine synthase, partial [Myxococcales bacterium]|nr:fused MFS/spermidine synthase [Myxococcales bacterium]